MRLVTWNILCGARPDRAGSVLEVLAALRPDVLALQECRGFGRTAGLQLEDVERATGLVGFLAAARSGMDLALLVPPDWPVRGRRAVREGFTHGVVVVRAGPPSGPIIRWITTHLDPFSEDRRVDEARRLGDLARLELGARAVLLGDLNALNGGDELPEEVIRRLPDQYRSCPGAGPPWRHDTLDTLLDAGWVDAQRACGAMSAPTYPTVTIPDPDGCPPLRIDHVLVDALTAGAVRSWRVVTEAGPTGASDHLPVLVELEDLGLNPSSA